MPGISPCSPQRSPNLPEFRVAEWEVVAGGAILSDEGERSATLQFPNEPRAEVVLQAVGTDDYESFACYFVENAQAMADFNNDGVPDLNFQQLFSPAGTVQSLKADGSIDTGNTRSLHNLPLGAIFPGPPLV